MEPDSLWRSWWPMWSKWPSSRRRVDPKNSNDSHRFAVWIQTSTISRQVGLCYDNQQISGPDIGGMWNQPGIPMLFPWPAVCCLFKSRQNFITVCFCECRKNQKRCVPIELYKDSSRKYCFRTCIFRMPIGDEKNRIKRKLQNYSHVRAPMFWILFSFLGFTR